MNLKTLVWRELAERPSAMLTSTLTILLGVAALVAIRHVTVFSEREVGQQLQSLGANVLVLPKDSTLQIRQQDAGNMRLRQRAIGQVG